jgi:hypothetical protein
MGFIISFRMSKMPFASWYHEIVMCGTDKIAMSISSLSNKDGHREGWMGLFEAYFGLLTKFVNPACLIMFIFRALASDLKEPYGIVQGYMPLFASIYVIIAILIIFAPMLMCDQPEIFYHNVELEFLADDIFETKARIKAKLAGMMAHMKPADGESQNI